MRAASDEKLSLEGLGAMELATGAQSNIFGAGGKGIKPKEVGFILTTWDYFPLSKQKECR
jgi:hypothetical protein